MIISFRKDKNRRSLGQAVREKRSIGHNKANMFSLSVCMFKVSGKGKVLCREGKPGTRWLDPVARPQRDRVQGRLWAKTPPGPQQENKAVLLKEGEGCSHKASATRSQRPGAHKMEDLAACVRKFASLRYRRLAPFC